MSKPNSKILVISDLHYPYTHRDTFDFLSEIKKRHKPDRIISIGDEIDGHSISFHPHDPNLLSPSDEFKQAIHMLERLYELFPKCEVLESNHGSLVYRKGTAHGLPRHVFRSYREILQAPRTWRWHYELTITMSNGEKVYFCHGKTANPMNLSQTMGMSAVQGHFHEKFAINYWANPGGLYWQMQVGCLINDKSLAFAYNNTNLKRPILGCGMIINGFPVLIPMVVNSKSRWIGKLV